MSNDYTHTNLELFKAYLQVGGPDMSGLFTLLIVAVVMIAVGAARLHIAVSDGHEPAVVTRITVRESQHHLRLLVYVKTDADRRNFLRSSVGNFALFEGAKVCIQHLHDSIGGRRYTQLALNAYCPEEASPLPAGV